MQHRGESTLQISLGGKAQVYCVHDWEKDQITTEKQLMEILKYANFKIKKGVHFIFKCSCCRNLFVDEGTEPRFCVKCRGNPVHPLGGPLPDPEGVVA